MKGIAAFFGIALFLIPGAGTVFAQEIKPIVVLQDSAPAMHGRSAKIKGTVEAIDLATRELTLKGPKGRPLTLRVVQRARNLNEVKVRDEVIVRYNESVAMELRKAEEDEILAAEEKVAQAPEPDEKQAGDAPKQMTVVTSVEAVSPREKTVTVTGPEGNLIDLYVRDPDVLAALAVGDKVVATYTEALAVLIELPKAKQKPKPRKKR